MSSLFFKKTSTFSKAINVLKHLEGVRTCAPGRIVLWWPMNREFWTTCCDLMKSHFCWVISLTYDPEMFEDMIVLEKKMTLIHGWEWVHVLQLPSWMLVNEDHQLPKMRNVIHPIDHTQPTAWWHIPTGRSNGRKCTGVFGLILFWDANSEMNFMENSSQVVVEERVCMDASLFGRRRYPIGFFPSIGWRYRCYLDDFETGRMCAYPRNDWFIHTQICCCALWIWRFKLHSSWDSMETSWPWIWVPLVFRSFLRVSRCWDHDQSR